MDDLAGLGKVADSKLANKLYDDAASPAIRELGDAAGDVIKTLRLFTAPFQLAATAQDRFKKWLEQAREKVPEERQVPAESSIAGPVLQSMLFLEEDNPLAEMFVNLLSKAIDKDTKGRVHPGYVRVLDHLSPDEAVLLTKFDEQPFLGVQVCYHIEEESISWIESLTTFPIDGFGEPNSIHMYCEHLVSLGLCRHDTDVTIVPPKEHPEWKNYRYYTLTSFGSGFLFICGRAKKECDERSEEIDDNK
jgi:hypothetical protein